MEILRKAANFKASVSDLKLIYTSFIRSVVEQSSNVWNCSLTQQNIDDLERIQRTALKIILRQKYKNYDNALKIMDLETLKDRRDLLNLKFAKLSVNNEKMKDYFQPKIKFHTMKTRSGDKYEVYKANGERYKNSPIIHMQRILNEHHNQ